MRWLVVLALLCTCGDPLPTPAQACHDLASWGAAMGARCYGLPYNVKELRAELMKTLSCNKAIAIRDRAELYGACRMQLQSLPCRELVLRQLPMACLEQVVVR